ncbi:hypothetical protein [Paenibacillus agilis]|uniref:Uncharacterized protein n=1 Tax=Paenibacillus agilis TaxID=3020863 RepID=A0A559J3B6_9BACL|nr:hypothetical protein [Paenibacillus agilis]TVX94374.1 hypothetical protein FPZ44_15720 [Paenibacillus agilis]
MINIREVVASDVEKLLDLHHTGAIFGGHIMQAISLLAYDSALPAKVLALDYFNLWSNGERILL